MKQELSKAVPTGGIKTGTAILTTGGEIQGTDGADQQVPVTVAHGVAPMRGTSKGKAPQHLVDQLDAVYTDSFGQLGGRGVSIVETPLMGAGSSGSGS
jgi:hypothetical protein